MGQSMVGRLAIRAKQIKPGDAFAAEVPAGGLVEIVDLEGKQVAEFVAFDQADPSEHLSLGVTRQQSKSIMLSLGMKLYSSRGRTMLDLVEDTVGRHDLLWAAPTGQIDPTLEVSSDSSDAASSEVGPVGSDEVSSAPATGSAGAAVDEDAAAVSPTTPGEEGSPDEIGAVPAVDVVKDDVIRGGDATAQAGSTDPVAQAPGSAVSAKPEPQTGFPAALAPFGLSDIDAPDPVNFFMQLAVMQRGDLEVRTPLSERGDRVVLQALTDLIVAVRCSSADDETNGEKPSDILVRVYR